jgi:Holliday junction resolvasome RuvABC endonuclease subunit
MGALVEKSTKILGCDPSLSATGIVVIDGAGNILFNEILKSKKIDVERLIDLRQQLLKIYSEMNIHLTVIEGYSFGSRTGQAFSLGEWGGVLKTALIDASIPFIITPPTQARKFMCGKGNLPKIMVPKEVYKKWKIDLDNDNLYDAYVLARVGLSYYLWKQGICKDSDFNKNELDILKIISKSPWIHANSEDIETEDKNMLKKEGK